MLRADTPDSLSLSLSVSFSLRRSIERQHWNTMIVETWTIERNLARCFRRRQRHCKRTDPLCCRTLPLSMPVRCLALIRQRMADDQSSYRKHRWITTPSDIPKSRPRRITFLTAFVSRWLEGGYLDEGRRKRRKEKSVPALS